MGFCIFCLFFSSRCNVDSKVSRVAWLNRTTILFAGSEKWSLDPRVILMENTAVTEYSIKIQNADVHDEGPYVCSILTNKKPKSTKVHLIVQGRLPPRACQWLHSTNNKRCQTRSVLEQCCVKLFCSVSLHFYRRTICKLKLFVSGFDQCESSVKSNEKSFLLCFKRVWLDGIQWASDQVMKPGFNLDLISDCW